MGYFVRCEGLLLFIGGVSGGVVVYVRLVSSRGLSGRRVIVGRFLFVVQ